MAEHRTLASSGLGRKKRFRKLPRAHFGPGTGVGELHEPRCVSSALKKPKNKSNWLNRRDESLMSGERVAVDRSKPKRKWPESEIAAQAPRIAFYTERCSDLQISFLLARFSLSLSLPLLWRSEIENAEVGIAALRQASECI